MEEELKRIKDILENHEERLTKLEKLFSSKPKEVKKSLSVKEFLISKKPRDDVQKTLIIGYYLEKYREMESFNANDLQVAFRESKEKVPTNINYKVIQNIKSGYMTEAKEKKDKLKAWYLTNSGEEFVENDLKKERA